jgi:hypothetical protein
MKILGKSEFKFPENSEEKEDWSVNGYYFRYGALASPRVMAYAHTRVEGAWCAYIDAVPGQNHDHEWQEVMRYGGKLPESIALLIFPEFEGLPYAL